MRPRSGGPKLTKSGAYPAEFAAAIKKFHQETVPCQNKTVDLIAFKDIYVKVESSVSIVKESNQHAGLKLLITRMPILMDHVIKDSPGLYSRSWNRYP